MGSPADTLLASRSRIYFLAGTHNPQITATFAPKGSMFLRVGVLGGQEFRKLDDGLTTNWIEDTPAVAGANQTLSNLTAPTSINQDLIMNPGKTLILPNDVFLLSQDAPMTGLVDLIKSSPDNYIKIGRPMGLVDPIGNFTASGAYDVSSIGAGTIRGIMSYIKSDGSTAQYLRGLQGYVYTEGGDNPGTWHRGIYASSLTNTGTISVGRIYGGEFFALHYNGIAHDSIQAISGFINMANLAVSAGQVQGANLVTNVNVGTVNNAIVGINSQVNTGGSFISANEIYGINNNLNLSQGLANNQVTGFRSYLSINNLFSAANGVAALDAGADIASGTYANGLTGGNIYCNVTGGFVNAPSLNGINAGTNWDSGNVTFAIIGVSGYAYANPGAGVLGGGLWGFNSDAIAQAGTMNEVVSYRGTARAINNAVINNFSGLTLFNEVDAGFTGTINFFTSANIGYDVRCVVPTIMDVHLLECTVVDNDGTPPNSVVNAHATGGGVRTAPNALKNAFQVRDDGGNALTTFEHGLDLQINMPFRTSDIKLAQGALIKNAVLGEIDVGSNLLRSIVDPVALQDAATKNYVDNYVGGLLQNSSFFGGFVNDNGILKSAIAVQKALAATTIENTGITANLQNAINAAAPGDVIEIQHNGPYGAVTIPGGKPLTIRAGNGFIPVFTGANVVALLNNVNNLFLIGLKFLNCTTTDSNAKGSAITFNTNLYKVDGLYVSDCIFERCTGCAINLSYHMSIGGDNYAFPYLPSELSTNVNIVDCTLLRACTATTEGAAILLRGMDGSTIRRCYVDSGDGSDPTWAGEGKTRGFMLQYAINSIIEDSTTIHTRNADEGFKFDQLAAASSTFKNTVILNRCYAEDCNEGFDNDDQGNIIFNQCAAYNCNEGFSMEKATSEGKILSCIAMNCKKGVYISAAVPTGTLEIKYNDIFNSYTKDYDLLNGYVLDTTNLQGSRPKILQKLIDDQATVNTYIAGPVTLGDAQRNIICNSAVGFVVNLPTAVGKLGRKYIIKNINIGVIAVTPNGVETIDGAGVVNLNQWNTITLISDNLNWYVIN